jgi:chromosome segregation ATPase
MSYFKMVEFLVKEVAKANEQIESLTRKAEDDKSVIDRLGKVHDKYFSEAKSAKSDLAEMAFERDDWKEDALRYREKEKQYWEEIDDLKSKIVSINQDRIKVVGELEDELKLTKKRYKSLIEQFKLSDKRYQDKIAECQLEINHLKNK